jgi:hypothetical protein
MSLNVPVFRQCGQTSSCARWPRRSPTRTCGAGTAVGSLGGALSRRKLARERMCSATFVLLRGQITDSSFLAMAPEHFINRLFNLGPGSVDSTVDKSVAVGIPQVAREFSTVSFREACVTPGSPPC